MHYIKADSLLIHRYTRSRGYNKLIYNHFTMTVQLQTSDDSENAYTLIMSGLRKEASNLQHNTLISETPHFLT